MKAITRSPTAQCGKPSVRQLARLEQAELPERVARAAAQLALGAVADGDRDLRVGHAVRGDTVGHAGDLAGNDAVRIRDQLGQVLRLQFRRMGGRAAQQRERRGKGHGQAGDHAGDVGHERHSVDGR
jgi:hypothetical protein